jgi:hypothetical protein
LNEKLWLDVEAAASRLADVIEYALAVHPESTREISVGEREDRSIEEVEELAEDATNDPHLRIRTTNEAGSDQYVAFIAVVPHRPHIPGTVGEVPVHGDDIPSRSSRQARPKDRAVAVTLGSHEPGAELAGERFDSLIVGAGGDNDARSGN